MLRSSGRTGTIASEEEDLPVAVEETYSGNYVVVFDPLDGSSNIDAGISVGSIFGAALRCARCACDACAAPPSQTLHLGRGAGAGAVEPCTFAAARCIDVPCTCGWQPACNSAATW